MDDKDLTLTPKERIMSIEKKVDYLADAIERNKKDNKQDNHDLALEIKKMITEFNTDMQVSLNKKIDLSALPLILLRYMVYVWGIIIAALWWYWSFLQLHSRLW